MSDQHSEFACIAAVRGAISVASNDAEQIREATARLLTTLLERNGLEPSRIVSALFTATSDLNADFPAHAARKLGWTDVPLLGAREIDVPGALPRIVRVLLTVSGVAPGTRLIPVYLDDAAALRPDLGTTSDASASVGQAASRSSTRARGDAGAEGSSTPIRRVAIIGLGQIGGSIGLALGGRGGWHRVGFDIDAEATRQAHVRGAIDEVAGSLESACARAELAVISTPVDALPGAIDRAAAALPQGAALLDTGSARSTVTPAIDRANAAGIRAVGGHPIAGGEGHGIVAARADLFRDAPFAIIPAGDDPPEIVGALIEALGARAIRVDPRAHDHALARTSHLPYLIACALRALGDESARRDLSGPGYRSMTRLAASDERMALAYCRANAREIASAWRELRGALDARVAELG